MKKFLFFMWTFFCLIININAEVTYNIEKSEYVKGSITVKGDNSTYGGASKLTLKGSDNSTITAYCTDPYAPAATGNNVTYREVSINESDKAAYESIWGATCGDETSAVPAVKTYMVNESNTIGYNSATQYAYNSVLNGGANYSGNIDELKGLVNGAKDAASSVKKGNSNNGVDISQTSSSFTISGADGSYSVGTGSGYSCVESTTNGKKVTRCSIDESFCQTNPDGAIDVPVTSNATEKPTAKPECQCKARMFEVSSGADGSTNQRFVACEKVQPAGGNAGGNGGNVPGEGIGNVEPITLTCDGFEEEEDFCDVPCDSFYDYIGDAGGTEYCDASGQVVVEVEEFGYADSYEDTFCCLKDNVKNKGNINGVEATNTILGENISLCEAYCTEKNYSLSLPGPTSDKWDDEVMVNAGTFFTIDGEMKSKSEIECYVTADYKALVNQVNSLRSRLATAITNLNRAKAEYSAEYRWDSYTEQVLVGYHQKYSCCSSCDYNVLSGTQCCMADGSKCRAANASDDYNRPIYEDGETHYTGYYKTPRYKKVGFNESGDNGGSYSTDWASASGETTCHINGPGEVCQEYKDFVTKAGKDIDTYKALVEDYQEDLDPNNSKGTLKKLLDEWDYCLTGWGFDKKNDNPDNGFNDRIENLANKCYTELFFNYEDGWAIGGQPTITAKVDGIPQNGDIPQKYGSEGNKNLKIGSCDDSGNCNENTKDVPYSDGFTHNKNIVTTTYQFQNKFCSPFDEEQEVYYLTSEKESCNGIILEGFPVSLYTPQGEYSYRYEYSGIGYLFDDASAGNCVGRLEPFIDVDSESYDNTCVYNVNNCRGCDVRCINKDGEFGKCDPSYCDDNRCKVTCVGGGCIFDVGAGFLATYRTISLANPFPIAYNNFDFAFNNLLAYNTPSPTKYFPTSNWKTTKGDKIKAEIASNGEKIYDGEPEYSVKLTPGDIKDIQEYNKNNSDYTTKKDLSCSIKDGAYTVCTSKFIRDDFADIFEKTTNTWESYGNYENEKFTGPAKK